MRPFVEIFLDICFLATVWRSLIDDRFGRFNTCVIHDRETNGQSGGMLYHCLAVRGIILTQDYLGIQ